MTLFKFATLFLVTFNAFAFKVTESYVTHNGVHRTLWWKVTCDNGKSFNVYQTQAEANKSGASYCKSQGSGFVTVNPTSTRSPSVNDSFSSATTGSFPVNDSRFTQSSF
jgi:hypothetical protein